MLNFERDKNDEHWWDVCVYPIGSSREVIARVWKPSRDGSVFIKYLDDGLITLSHLEFLAQGAKRIQDMPFIETEENYFSLGTPRPEHPIPEVIKNMIFGVIKEKLG